MTKYSTLEAPRESHSCKKGAMAYGAPKCAGTYSTIFEIMRRSFIRTTLLALKGSEDLILIVDRYRGFSWALDQLTQATKDDLAALAVG